MTKSQRWIIQDIYGSFFLRADGSWSQKRSEAEVFASYDEAFRKSAERHNRYPVAF